MRRILLILALIAGLALPAQMFGGDSSAILGTEGWFAGALPPPGFTFINYLTYVNGDKIKDADGHTIKAVDFDLDVVANVMRLIYVADITILDANLAWHVVVPLVYQDAKVQPPIGGFSEDHFGLGDCYISPFILGWHSELFHWVLGLDIITPTGQYSKSDNASIGSNHWTFEPAFAVSFIHPDGISASVKFMYDFHTENDDTKETTGQQFHMDYNVGYQVAEDLRLGIGGYYLKGTQSDEIDSNTVPGTIEQCFAVGPSAMYSFNPALHLIAKLQYETMAENRAEVDRTWVKLIYSF